MQVGHINLDKSMNGIGEHVVRLVESLGAMGVRQHIIVRNKALAKRLVACADVTVGPTVTTAVTAYCLMPQVAVVHTHDEAAGHAGLLLTLTRSIPYVLSRRSSLSPGRNPVVRSVYGRAAGVICPSDRAAAALGGQYPAVCVDVIADFCCQNEALSDDPVNHIAAEHLRVYRRAVDSGRVPALLL